MRLPICCCSFVETKTKTKRDVCMPPASGPVFSCPVHFELLLNEEKKKKKKKKSKM